MKKIKANRDKYTILVDNDDYDRVMEAAGRCRWHVCARDGKPRRVRCGPQRGPHLYLHRFLMSPEGDEVVRYLDKNALDNRKKNLRVLSRFEARQGTKLVCKKKTSSQYIGVVKNGHGWDAAISAGGVCHRLGYYEEEVHAARAYDIAAKKHHGQFALINDIPEDVVPVKTSKLRKKTGRASIYIGVGWSKQRQCWTASIRAGGMRTFLGCYEIQIHAARAYDIEAKERRGEDTITNNISEDIVPVRGTRRRKNEQADESATI